MRKMKSGPATAGLLWVRRLRPATRKNTGPREAATVDGEPKGSQRSAAAAAAARPSPRREAPPKAIPQEDPRRSKNDLGGLGKKCPTTAGNRRRSTAAPQTAETSQRDEMIAAPVFLSRAFVLALRRSLDTAGQAPPRKRRPNRRQRTPRAGTNGRGQRQGGLLEIKGKDKKMGAPAFFTMRPFLSF